MAGRSKTYRDFSWEYFIIQLLLIAGVGLLIAHLKPSIQYPVAMLLGFAAYYAYAALSRSFILPHHMRAMRLFRKRDYAAAIRAFEQSERFLLERPWIDRYRWLILLSASGLSYREMALYNIAAAQAALGQSAPARRTLTRFLQEYPGSPLATRVRAALALLDQKKKK